MKCEDCGEFFTWVLGSTYRNRRKCPTCANDAEATDALRGPYELNPRYE